jgi:hypothetical protein
MISNFGGRVALRNRRLAHARLLLEDLSLARNETLVGTMSSGSHALQRCLTYRTALICMSAPSSSVSNWGGSAVHGSASPRGLHMVSMRLAFTSGDLMFTSGDVVCASKDRSLHYAIIRPGSMN